MKYKIGDRVRSNYKGTKETATVVHPVANEISGNPTRYSREAIAIRFDCYEKHYASDKDFHGVPASEVEPVINIEGFEV